MNLFKSSGDTDQSVFDDDEQKSVHEASASGVVTPVNESETTSDKLINDASNFPDGGTKAWLNVIGGGAFSSPCLDGPMVSGGCLFDTLGADVCSVWCVSELLPGTSTQRLYGFSDLLDFVCCLERSRSDCLLMCLQLYPDVYSVWRRYCGWQSK